MTLVKKTGFEKILEEGLKICEESLENVFLFYFRIRSLEIVSNS